MGERFKYGRAFSINSDDSLPCITDSEKDKDYFRMSDIVNVLNKQQATIDDLERKLRICSAHLLSDECCLTEGQIRKIIKEMTNE